MPDLIPYAVNYLYKQYCENLYKCKSDIKVSKYKYLIQMYLIKCFINTVIEVCILKENIENSQIKIQQLKEDIEKETKFILELKTDLPTLKTLLDKLQNNPSRFILDSEDLQQYINTKSGFIPGQI